MRRTREIFVGQQCKLSTHIAHVRVALGKRARRRFCLHGRCAYSRLARSRLRRPRGSCRDSPELAEHEGERQPPVLTSSRYVAVVCCPDVIQIGFGKCTAAMSRSSACLFQWRLDQAARAHTHAWGYSRPCRGGVRRAKPAEACGSQRIARANARDGERKRDVSRS